MNQKALAGVFALAVIIIGTFVISYNKATSQPEHVVKIGYFNQHLGSVPIFMTEEKGYFAEKGVKVELTALQSSNLMTDALVRGDIDMGVVSMIPVLNAEAVDPGKIKLVAASVITNESPFDQVVVKAGSTITSLTDPKITKIAVFPGTTATNFLKAYLKSQSVDVSKIEFVQMPPQNQLPALTSGAVQAAHMLEPGLTIAITQGQAKPITKSIYASTFEKSPIGALGISGAFVRDEPALAKKTVEAIEQGIAYQNGHADETRSLIAKRFTIAPEVVAKMNLLSYARFQDLAPTFLNSFADLLASMGELKIKPNLDQLIYRVGT